MGQLHVPEPAVIYTGGFFFDFDRLYCTIKQYHGNWSLEDPSTWPRYAQNFEWLSRYTNRLSQLPTGLAYSKDAIDNVLSKYNYAIPPISEATPHKTGNLPAMNSRFHKYPFNFDSIGMVKAKVGISKAHYEEWMNFNNPEPRTKKVETLANMTTQVSPDPNTKTTTAVADPKTSYDDIMKTLTAIDDQLRISEEGRLQAEERANKAEDRANKAEQLVTTLQQEHTKAMKDAITQATMSLRTRLAFSEEVASMERKRARTAEEKIKTLEQELKDTKAELVAAKKDAHEKNAQLENIGVRVNEIEGARKGKRKAGDEDTRGLGKKAKG